MNPATEHPSLPPEAPMTEDNRLLELRLFWGDRLLGLSHYDKPAHVLVGETRRADVFLSSEGLPAPELPLVRYADGDYLMTFARGMEGEVELGGRLLPLEALTGMGARPHETLEGAFELALPKDARAVVHHGGATMALRFVAPSERLEKRPLEQLDLGFLNFVLSSLLFHVVWIAILLSYPYDVDSLREQLFDKPDRFVQLIVAPQEVKPETADLLRRLEQKAATPSRDAAKPKQPAATPPEAQDDQPSPRHRPRDPGSMNAQRDAIQKKFNSLFAGGEKFSGRTGSLSGSLAMAIGRTAPVPGLAIRGSLRGEGPIAGGPPGTVGIAAIETPGRDPGFGSDAPIGPRRRRDLGFPGAPGRDRVAPVDLGPPVVCCGMAPELIRRVIEDNKNQVRFCYERELQAHQDLAGRVALRWTIGPDGRVTAARVTESTLGNARVERCIVERVKTWRFPEPPGGGTVDVNYPFVLRAS